MSEAGMKTASFNPQDYSLYVHIPFCRRKCRYCAFYSTVDASELSRYLRAAAAELEMRRPRTTARTVYIGGGSPSLLAPAEAVELIERIGPEAADREFTVEVNPAQASLEFLRALRGAGVNRLSIGAQSFRREELERLGRIHRAEETAAAVENGRRAGFDNISVDLIFAIPGSTLADWRYSLEQAIGLGPEHISAYSLTYEEGTALWRDREAGRIEPVDEETDAAMYETAIETLEGAGYEQVEISNFARRGYACEHNVRCWKNLPYIGLGPSAASWYGGRRTENVADVKGYMERIERGEPATAAGYAPTAEEVACETAVLNLRMREGIDRREYARRFGADPAAVFAGAAERNAELGLLEVTEERIRLSRRALAVADAVMADFALPDQRFITDCKNKHP